MEEEVKPDGEKPEGEKKAEKAKVVFDEIQQGVIQSLIDKKFTEAYGKAKGEYEPRATAAEARVAALEAELVALKAQKPASRKEEKQQDADAEALKTQIEELKTNFKTVQTEREELKTKLSQFETERREAGLEREFNSVAREFDFFDPEDVLVSLRRSLKWENGKYTVVHPRTGAARHNSEMEPMSLGELVAEYARSKPYSRRAPDAQAGTGGGPSNTPAQSKSKVDWKEAARMSAEQFEASRNEVLGQRR